MATRISIFCKIPARPLAQAKPKYPRMIRVPLISLRGFSRFNRTAAASDIAKALKDDGYVVIENMYTPTQVARLNKDMDIALANVSVGRPANTNTAPLPDGADPRVFGANTKRLGNMINHSPVFREEIIESDALHSVSTEIFKELGDYWLSTAQMIEMGPGSKRQPMHPDGAGWWTFWAMGNDWQPEFAVTFLIATTDTTKANGATSVAPGSHRINYKEAIEKDPTFGFWEYPDDQVEQIELKAGDCLLLGSRIVHRGEENKTNDEYRRILSCFVTSSSLTPEEAHPLILEKEKAQALSERAKKFLAFREHSSTIGTGVWQDHRKGGLKRTLGF